MVVFSQAICICIYEGRMKNIRWRGINKQAKSLFLPSRLSSCISHSVYTLMSDDMAKGGWKSTAVCSCLAAVEEKETGGICFEHRTLPFFFFFFLFSQRIHIIRRAEYMLWISSVPLPRLHGVKFMLLKLRTK